MHNRPYECVRTDPIGTFSASERLEPSKFVLCRQTGADARSCVTPQHRHIVLDMHSRMYLYMGGQDALFKISNEPLKSGKNPEQNCDSLLYYYSTLVLLL
jgi:hypothetical protein